MWSPTGIESPVNENPITVPDELYEMVKPASSATPPEAEFSSIPETVNWNPATGTDSKFTVSYQRRC